MVRESCHSLASIGPLGSVSVIVSPDVSDGSKSQPCVPGGPLSISGPFLWPSQVAQSVGLQRLIFHIKSSFHVRVLKNSSILSGEEWTRVSPESSFVI